MDRDKLLNLAAEMDETANLYESRYSDDMRRWASVLRAVAGSATPTHYGAAHVTQNEWTDD
jgi:hypothetical protein